jgi:hypothetical protein
MHRTEIAHRQKDKASEREKEAQRMTVRLSINRRTTENLYKEREVEEGKQPVN